MLLPLDDRPSTLLFPQQIARIGGGELIVPPRGLLGKWLEPGQSGRLELWMISHCEGCERLFVSSDMLCYGGLVASRSAAVTLAEAQTRLQTLSTLHGLGQHLEVLATIPRLDLRTSDREAPYARRLQNWAASPAALEHPPTDVPADIVQEYLGVRQRNFAVLETLVALTGQGVIDRLIIGQDDSSRAGLHERDQHRLNDIIARSVAADRITLLSGADELAMDMVSGWLAERSNLRPRFAIAYSDDAAAEQIPPLESLPLSATVAAHLRLAGADVLAPVFQIAPSPGKQAVTQPCPTAQQPRPAEAMPAPDAPGPDGTLFIAAPQHGWQAPPPEEAAARAQQIIEHLKQLLTRSPHLGVANAIYVNRSDPELAQDIMQQLDFWRLDGYAGWNTTSNTLGTVIAQMVAHAVADRTAASWDLSQMLESEKTHVAFLLARLVDDYYYQAVVRQQMTPLANQLSDPTDPLLNQLGPIALQVRLDLIHWANDLFTQRLAGRTVSLPGHRGEATMQSVHVQSIQPWPRLFEVEALVDVRLAPITP